MSPAQGLKAAALRFSGSAGRPEAAQPSEQRRELSPAAIKTVIHQFCAEMNTSNVFMFSLHYHCIFYNRKNVR